MPDTIASEVRHGCFGGAQLEIEFDPATAHKFSVTAGAGSEFVSGKMQWETHFSHFYRTKLEPASGMPFAAVVPAVTAR